MSSLRWRIVATLLAGALAPLRATPVPAHPPSVDSLWSDEGRTLHALLETARGEDRGELLFRLGEWERESAERLRRSADADSGPTADAIRRHQDAAEAALQQAVSLAAVERLPHVLLSLGEVRRSRGNVIGAREPFATLVTKFPDHPLAVDAALALGDDAFDAGGLAQAMARYEFADRHATRDGTRAYARYKLAWCHLNLEELAVARKLLLDVIALAQAGGGKLSLADEARRDYVLALARDASIPAGTAQADIRSLQLPKDRTRRYEEGYARLIAGSGRDPEALDVLASLEPGAPPADAASICTAQLEVAVRQRNLPVAVAAGQKLANTLSAFGRPSAEKADAAEKALRVAAVTLHGEGRARADQGTLRAALALYDDYFLAFDAEPAAYELHHHAGELLASLHEPALAERHFTAAVERDLAAVAKGRPPGKWLAASALGAVNTATDALPAMPPVAHASPTSDEDVTKATPAATPLTPAEQIFVDACDRFLKALPQSTQARDVSYQRALALYRHNRFSDAEPVLESIVLQKPDDSAAQFAAQLALDALRQQRRYDDLARLAVTFQARTALAAKLGAELGEVRESAILAGAALRAGEGQDSDAAQRYLDFAAHFPASPRLDKAIYNGAAALTREGRLTEAIHTRERLLTTMRKSPLLSRARQQQLSDLLRLGRFAEASRLASDIADDEKGVGKAERQHDAVALAEAAGDLRDADLLRVRYIHDHPHGDDAMPYALALADRARGCAARTTAARLALSLAPNLSWRLTALSRLASVEQRCHDEAHARAHAAEAVALGGKSKAERAEALDAPADADLLLAEQEAAKYRTITLGPPYERTLPRKLNALKSVDDHLARVVARGRARAAVCALVQSGLAYGDLARELDHAHAPRGLTSAQQDLFREALSEKSQPLFDHARQTFDQALKRAREAGVEPQCATDARGAMAMLWPERFGPRLDVTVRLQPELAARPAEPSGLLARAPDAPAAWLVAARDELAVKHPEAAIVLSDRIDSRDILQPQALELKALAFDALGQTDAALGLWLRLTRDFPRRSLAHRVLVDRALAHRDFEGARQHLVALKDAGDQDPSVAIDLGVVLRALGDVKGAEGVLRDAAAREPRRPEASLDLGLLLCADGGQPREGIAALDRFVQAGGHAQDAKAFEAAVSGCRALAKGGQP